MSFLRRSPVSSLRLAALAALLAGCNAASSGPVDDEDVIIVDTGVDDTNADVAGFGDAGSDIERRDTGSAECDPFEDDACPCDDGVLNECYDGPADAAGRGVCRKGYATCEDGRFGACIGQVVPREETCNGLDDDCDGVVDNGVANACGSCGEPPAEICGDGYDNDCDGEIDEVEDGCDCDGRTNQPCYGGPPGTAGMGTCRGGVTSCVDGAWLECAGQVLPEAEVCNGEDDDCDGEIDEGLLNACGECGPVPAEECNYVDDDCDGLIDEGVRLPCGLCSGDTPGREVCGDGFDNDCDGTADEGCACIGDGACYPGDPVRAGVGQCTFGTRECDSSGELWLACTGYGRPTIEVCDGEDNDCDGTVDLDTRGCSVCSTAVEVCNGVDDDCDGEIDEGTRNGCGDCLADVVPEESGGPELCNGEDDDCDGLVDEGLVNACGACDESCYVATETPDPSDIFDDGAELIDGDDPNNPTGRPGVTLSSRSFIPPYLWAANHTDDTVSRFHIEDNEEQGRYWVGDNPSRTAVDLDGNVWIGGRNDGRLTKVLWNVETCPDRNGNDTVDTSRPGAIGPINSAADPLADECVAYSAVPNPSRPSIRGIAAGPDGRMWIGYTAGGIQSIDPNTFELGPFVDPSGVPALRPDAGGVYRPSYNPDGSRETADAGGVYGLVVDSDGMLYTSSIPGRDRLPRFDTVRGEWDGVMLDYPCGSYGIALDGDDRVWTGGWRHCRGVGMFDPATRTAHVFAVPDGVTPSSGLEFRVDATDPGCAVSESCCGSPNFCVTGLGVEPATGNVWASFYAVGYTGRLIIDEANLAASRWRLIGTARDDAGDLLEGVGNDFRGVGFDRNGFAWTLGLSSGRVWKIDPATERRAADLPGGAPVGVGGHYTYSDFTGSTALTFTAPRALWGYVFEAGYDEAKVDSIRWEASLPAGTTAGIRARVVDEDGRAVSAWAPSSGYVAYPAGDASAEVSFRSYGLVGRYFEIEVNLTTDDVDVRPIVHRVDMYWQRP